jgi:uncharacterized protein (DUF302 family)
MKYSKILTSVALSALLLSGCGSSSSTPENNATKTTEQNTTTPYLRVAVLEGGWDKVPTIANMIAQSIDSNDESQTLGYPSNWVVAGANHEQGESLDAHDILGVPIGKTGQKGHLVELCNGEYAKMAMGTGRFHGPALPCQVSVHSDGNKTYIDMLNPEAIFSMFFNDFNDTSGSMETMAQTVKNEIKGMLLEAIKSETFTPSNEALGPKFTKEDIAKLDSPYIIYKYTIGDKALTHSSDAKAIAHALIETLGSEAAPSTLEGLSEGAAWRPAREDALAIPGAFVVEACSPTYAKKATQLGSEYLTALPCEFAVYIDESDESNKTLAISILNPEFMFMNMFKGAIENGMATGKITETEMNEFMSLPKTVKDDLLKVVEHVVKEHNLTKIN